MAEQKSGARRLVPLGDALNYTTNEEHEEAAVAYAQPMFYALLAALEALDVARKEACVATDGCPDCNSFLSALGRADAALDELVGDLEKPREDPDGSR